MKLSKFVRDTVEQISQVTSYEDVPFIASDVRDLLEKIRSNERCGGMNTVGNLIDWLSEDPDLRMVTGFLGNGVRSYNPSRKTLRLGLIKILKVVGGYRVYRFGKIEVVTTHVPKVAVAQ